MDAFPECVEALVRLLLLLLLQVDQQQRVNRREMWVRDLFLARDFHGYFVSLLPELIRDPDYGLESFCRLDLELFEKVARAIAPAIAKCRKYRVPISVEERLAIALRYYATGESYASLSFQFRVSRSAISRIVREVSEAIRERLGPIYLETPCTQAEWLQKAKEFYEKWNFANCIGALDGKHVAIKKPAGSGTNYFNFKKFFSVVLFAMADANCKFTYVNVGTNGVIGDAGIWNRCDLHEMIKDDLLDIPKNGQGMPYVILGDEAFPLLSYLMKPFRRALIGFREAIFNARLSRARRTVENAFGILSARFRVLQTTMQVDPDTAISVTYAICILHNMNMSTPRISQNYANLTDEERELPQMSNYAPTLTEDESANGVSVREQFADYFLREGSLDFVNDRFRDLL